MAFLAAVFAILLFVDIAIYDRIRNPYFNNALQYNNVRRNILIGSSKTFWGIQEDVCGDLTVIATPGQFALGSLSVLMKLEQAGLLKEKRIFLDLQDGNELKAGYGNWWYMSDAFFKYRYAHFSDYDWTEWPLILSRIVVDVTDFGQNEPSEFNWIPIEEQRPSINLDLNTLRTTWSNYKNCKTEFRSSFSHTIRRLSKEVSRIERSNNCQIFLIVLPVPKRGCTENLNNQFGIEKVIDLSALDYSPKDFHDYGHVNAVGAKRLSSYMLEILDCKE